MNRRRFVCACCMSPLAAALARAQAAQAGCSAALPGDLARHELVAAAWEGLDPRRVWDVHAHLVGTGDSGGGAWVDPRTETWRHPIERFRRKVILDAACVQEDGAVDQQYRARLHALVAAMPVGFRMMLLAFDYAVDADGREMPQRSTLATPDAFAMTTARSAPDRFEWAASIHPYREDALQRLDEAARQGARALKWLPSSMNIDPSSPRCDAFYARLAQLRLPLLVHCGEEVAAPGARQAAFNNPLRIRRALDAGVRVIVAHAASLGRARDLDAGGRDGPMVASFTLLRRLFDDRRYEKLLFADLSAVFQRNRDLDVQRELLRRSDWHPRLLHGSDYPLPGIGFVYSLDRFVSAGWLARPAAGVLERIRRHNPLLFEFVLKRSLADGPHRLDAAVFHTRDVLATLPR